MVRFHKTFHFYPVYFIWKAMQFLYINPISPEEGGYVIGWNKKMARDEGFSDFYHNLVMHVS